jgi:GNAT superfamily N-acetyltransferase
LKQVRVRPAEKDDVQLIFDLIRDLAVYEKLDHIFALSQDTIRDAIFAPRPSIEVLIGELDGKGVGLALFYPSYSTFLGRRGIFLEDLFVRPQARGHGVGKALLVALANVAVERDCARLEWYVLDWNTPSIAFYESLGASAMEGWKIFRLPADGIRRLAERPDRSLTTV